MRRGGPEPTHYRRSGPDPNPALIRSETHGPSTEIDHSSANRHPYWCVPDFFDDYGGERNHTSAPVTIEAYDARYQMDLERLDGQETPMVWLFARSKVVDQQITVYIDTDSEVDALITALTALRDLARGEGRAT